MFVKNYSEIKKVSVFWNTVYTMRKNFPTPLCHRGPHVRQSASSQNAISIHSDVFAQRSRGHTDRQTQYMAALCTFSILCHLIKIQSTEEAGRKI